MHTTRILSPYKCKENPNNIYVFGDNLIKKGRAGQAIIRNESNAFGIPTKRLPSMDSNAFFSDTAEEYTAVSNAINKLIDKSTTITGNIIFPKDGLGTNLAHMKKNSPGLFKFMNETLNKYFNGTL